MNPLLRKILGLVVLMAEWNLTLNAHDRAEVETALEDEELREYLRKARQQDLLPVPRDPCVYDFLGIHPADDEKHEAIGGR